MRPASARARASIVLAATLLPFCALASPLRLQFVRCDSAVRNVPALNARSCEKRSVYGLKEAVKLEEGTATLVPASATDADVRVEGKVERVGKKYRVVYVLQTQRAPTLRKELAYELARPRLTNRGVTDMAMEVLAEGVKLEASRLDQAATQAAAAAPAPEAPAASAPATPDEPWTSVSSRLGGASPQASAPAAGAASTTDLSAPPAPPPSEPVAADSESRVDSGSPAYADEEFVSHVRQQPLVVIHTGLAGLWNHGMSSYGLGLVLEPKWNITDSLAAGLRFDGGFTFGGSINAGAEEAGSVSLNLGASAAMLLKGEYLLGDRGVRPFFGLGAGLYSLAGQSLAAGETGAGVSQEGGRFFGVAPQLGIDFGPLRLGVTYNAILGADVVVRQDVSVGDVTTHIARNYVQLELSGRILSFGRPKR